MKISTSHTKESQVPISHFLSHFLANQTDPLRLPPMASAAKSFVQTLRCYIKKPWEITGPVSGPEYMNAVPKATEYRIFCPANVPEKAIVPTSEPETVFDIKYYSRDQGRNRPPIRRKILKKADVEKMMKETNFDVNDFPRPYLTAKAEEDDNAISGGYQK
ncbi:Mitochondrial distribution and morphology protein [Actinidia chinensis var. chinensis]|uniref:Mitochondrial distribution and morphology protein n=1 Tax=Actinidia chinensis var. chinensis TaxID=1590841 RepID=A0A2R6RYK1_ACTCC|nr:Mitochondrial distribution and morphology protein [Actinidia chinensis var. chinensis]